MARNYGQIFTGIWRDRDWLNLDWRAQWAYMMLSTQAEISAVGMLPLSSRRWASRARDTTRNDIVDAIRVLADARMVVYDMDTEELLLRTFVKWDRGYTNRKRLPVIERAAAEVESLRLRAVLAGELAKLGLPVEWVGDLDGVAPVSVPDGEPFSAGDVPDAAVSAVPAQRTPETLFSQANTVSGTPSPSDGVVDIPQPATRKPQPSVPPTAAHAGEVVLFGAAELVVTRKTPKPRDIAFGLANWWIDVRAQKNIPVVAGGKAGPLHPLRSLFEGFVAAGYSEDEIKQAMVHLDRSFPSKNMLDNALAGARLNQANYQGRADSYLGRRDGQRMPVAERRLMEGAALAAQMRERAQSGGNR